MPSKFLATHKSKSGLKVLKYCPKQELSWYYGQSFDWTRLDGGWWLVQGYQEFASIESSVTTKVRSIIAAYLLQIPIYRPVAGQKANARLGIDHLQYVWTLSGYYLWTLLPFQLLILMNPQQAAASSNAWCFAPSGHGSNLPENCNYQLWTQWRDISWSGVNMTTLSRWRATPSPPSVPSSRPHSPPPAGVSIYTISTIHQFSIYSLYTQYLLNIYTDCICIYSLSTQ